MSYSQDLLKWNNGNAGGRQPAPEQYYPDHSEYYLPPQAETMRPIMSAGVEYLTSDSLIPLRDLIMTARDQRAEVCADLLAARELAPSQRDELQRRQVSLFRYFYKKRIAALIEALPVTLAEVERLEEWEKQTHIKIDFEAGNYPKYAYSVLEEAFAELIRSRKIWDITADRATNQFVERTTAGRTVERKPVRFDFAYNDLLQFEGDAMKLANANGSDVLIYPGMALIPGNGGAFALIDLRELELIGYETQFHESESVPADAKVIGHTWFKTNKDGSQDKRFRDHYQIPIARYGNLRLNTETGLREEYIISNAEATGKFAHAFSLYQQALQLAEEDKEIMAALD